MRELTDSVIGYLITKKDELANDLQDYVVETIDTIHTDKKFNELKQFDIDFINKKRVEIAKIYDYIEWLEKNKDFMKD